MVLICLAACGPSGPQGIAFVRVTELSGACPVEPDLLAGGPKFPTDNEYRRAHAVTSVQGDSRFAGGNLIVTAWKDPDGRVSRMYVDVGPDRGYGDTLSPATTWTQAFGYVEWLGGQRVFAATRSDGALTYRWSEADEGGFFKVKPPPGKPPGAVFSHQWFTGIDASGAPACRLIALHADATALREEAYDLSWLAANPTAMIVEGANPAAPTFTGDVEPGSTLVLPDQATKDPGSAAPRLDFKGGTFGSGSGGSSACD